THPVGPRRQCAYVAMRTFEIAQADFGDLVAVIVEERRARVRLCTHWIIIRQDRRAVIDAFLMRCRYIAERWALVKDIVPRERKIGRKALFWTVGQMEIRDEPRIVLKLFCGKRRCFSKTADRVRRGEHRARED